MDNEKPKIVIMEKDPDREPLPFPIFFSCQQPRTDQQIRNTARRWEADAVFGFYKLKLSAIDEVKMLSYLDSEISADQLIQRFVSMT